MIPNGTCLIVNSISVLCSTFSWPSSRQIASSYGINPRFRRRKNGEFILGDKHGWFEAGAFASIHTADIRINCKATIVFTDNCNL